MEACESQQQLHGDGLYQEHCVQCSQRISSVFLLPCWKVGDTLILPWLLHLLYDECKGSSVSCGEPMYHMHLRLDMSYTVVYWYLAWCLTFRSVFPAGLFRSEQYLSSAGPRFCCHQRSLYCFPYRQMSRPLLLVHLPPGLLRMFCQIGGFWFWTDLSEDETTQLLPA